jgi:dipeptidyl aminopeptidase/acylaminoacyl peptidase
MIALPPNFDERKKYPLLVVMHGGPHSMWRDNWGLRWNYFMLSAARLRRAADQLFRLDWIW